MTTPTTSNHRSLAERLTDQFYQWEKRGRGWQLWDAPVELEPPFTPFWGHYTDNVLPDDGRRQTALSSLFGRLTSLVTGSTSPAQATFPEEEEPTAREADEERGRVELQILLPGDFNGSCKIFEAFILGLSYSRHVVSFELIGDFQRVRILITANEADASRVEEQLAAYFPDVVTSRQENILRDAWQKGGGESLVVDFGLSREFMTPLTTYTHMRTDPLVGLVASLAHLREGELAVVQVIFKPVKYPWSQSILRAVTAPDGSAFFDDAPEFLKSAKDKISKPLFAAVVRIATQRSDEERTWEIARGITSGLVPFGSPNTNELIPLTNDEYDDRDHEDDLLSRRTRRSGMLLNSEELVSLVHLPAAEVQNAKLERFVQKSKAAPETVLGHPLVLGNNLHNGRSTKVTLSPDQRVRHMHVIGASGTGKSTFLLNLIMQDIEKGEGVGVVDPHGDLIDHILARIPEHRIKDVVLVDPSDDQYPIAFNILSAHSDLEKTLLSSDLVGIFRRFSTSWGDQMSSVLGNAVLAFLESNRGGTLADLRRFLIEPAFRTEFLSTVQDSHVVYYWKKEFPLLTGRPQAPLLTRLDTFLRPKPVRYMVAQDANRLDFAHIMDTGKIFLAKLSQGAIGEENAHLLGSLIVSKFHQITLGRQAISEASRKYFWLYCDEFGGYVTPSMARLLSGARKYRLGLVLAHQELRQLKDPDVESALLANAGSRVVFRVGDSDAKTLAEGFATFDAKDLRNLSTGEAICRVGRADDDFNLTTPMVNDVPTDIAATNRNAIVEFTRKTYATARATVEEYLAHNQAEDRDEHKAAKPTAAPVTKEVVQATEQPAPAPIENIPEAKVEQPLPPTPAVQKPKIPPAMMEQGRGGKEHKYHQHLLTQWAQGMGYRATIEMQTPDGAGSIDVVLEKDNRRIACEISVTSTVEQELGNLRKCLAAGFSEVFMICVEGKTLKGLKKAAEAEIDAKMLEKVRFVSPEEMLSSMALLETGSSKEQTVRGYKVKVKLRPVGDAESVAKRQVVSKVLMRATKKKDVI